uniref:Uncharacterized protein n=1 Tax=Plectus sambesii TaxID=2011161 RepID=A0A914UQV7_9BILA
MSTAGRSAALYSLARSRGTTGRCCAAFVTGDSCYDSCSCAREVDRSVFRTIGWARRFISARELNANSRRRADTIDVKSIVLFSLFFVPGAIDACAPAREALLDSLIVYASPGPVRRRQPVRFAAD